VLALAFNETSRECDLQYSGGCAVAEGFDLETAVMLSLFCDAPAQEGDDVLPGTPRRGWLFDVLDADGDVFGSRLWLLEQAEASEVTAQRARTYGKEATQRLVDAGYVRAIDFETQVGDEAVELTTLVTKKDGRTVTLGPFKVN
jgi:phage gp46-like protein